MRAKNAYDAVSEYFSDDDDAELFAKVTMVQDEWRCIDELKEEWARDTNQEFINMKKDKARTLRIAAVEYGLSQTVAQSQGSRLANTKIEGDNGRRVMHFTSTGVRYGGGVISHAAKSKALNEYEAARYEEGTGFVPIKLDDGSIDDEYKRFLSNEEKKQAKDDGVDLRRNKRGGGKPVYVGAAVDAERLFQVRLKQLVLEDEFAVFDHHYTKYEDVEPGQVVDVKMCLIGAFDGYGADGHYLSHKRSLHNFKFVGFGDGLEGSPLFAMRVLQFMGAEADTECYKLRKEFFYGAARRISGRKHDILLPNDVVLRFDVLWAATFDLAACKRDKGCVGTSGWSAFVDTVIWDPVAKSMDFIDKHPDFEVAQLPHVYPWEIDLDLPKNKVKHTRNLLNVPRFKEIVADHLAFLDRHYPVDYDGEYTKDPNHAKRLELARGHQTKRKNYLAMLEDAGLRKTVIIYPPIWQSFSLFAVDPMHFNINGGCHLLAFLARKLSDWEAQDVIDKAISIIESDMQIRACFAGQFEQAFDEKQFYFSVTNKQCTRILYRYYDLIETALPAINDDAQCLVLVTVLELLHNMQQLRAINEKVVFENGLEDADLARYHSLSNWRYKVICQILPSFCIPYEQFNFFVIQHKMIACIQITGYGIGISSTSIQEHSQKKDKEQASKHSNYDYDEIVRHSNLSSIGFGIDHVRKCGIDLKAARLKNLNKKEERYGARDKARYEDVVGGLQGVAKEIHDAILEQDFNEKLSEDLSKYV